MNTKAVAGVWIDLDMAGFTAFSTVEGAQPAEHGGAEAQRLVVAWLLGARTGGRNGHALF